MKTPISRRIPPARPLPMREVSPPPIRGDRHVRMSSEASGLLAAEEPHVLMEADNVGMEQLIAALTRVRIPRRKSKTAKSTT
jgi:hypothetical protein